jgi:hypothetical protein
MPIYTTGRTDIDDFFEKSGILTHKKLSHYPYLVFVEDPSLGHETNFYIYTIDSTAKLVSSDYPNDTDVMAQWPGNYRSDFMRFTIGDVRNAVKAQETSRQPNNLFWIGLRGLKETPK